MRTWLKKTRENLGYSQSALAEKFGISQQGYALIERGQRLSSLDIDTAYRFSQILKVPLAFIIEQELSTVINETILSQETGDKHDERLRE